MKTPYLNMAERKEIYLGTTLGAMIKLNLAKQILVRNILKPKTRRVKGRGN